MSKFDRDQLRVAPPTLEPDPVLLGRLAALSAASTPAPHTARTTAVRLLSVAASVAAIGATTWVAGALPGIDSPVAPAEQPTHGPATPGTEASETPQSDASIASGSPTSPGLPDATSSSEPHGAQPSGDDIDGADVPRGKGHDNGDEKHDGKHEGRGDSDRGPKDPDDRGPQGPKDGHDPKGPKDGKGPQGPKEGKGPQGPKEGKGPHRGRGHQEHGHGHGYGHDHHPLDTLRHES